MLPSKLGKKMFKQFWWAKGDYILTDEEFIHLVDIVKYKKMKKIGENPVTFYGTIEARTFGSATFFLDRTIKNELFTDLPGIGGVIYGAKDFSACYGTGCK